MVSLPFWRRVTQNCIASSSLATQTKKTESWLRSSHLLKSGMSTTECKMLYSVGPEKVAQNNDVLVEKYERPFGVIAHRFDSFGKRYRR